MIKFIKCPSINYCYRYDSIGCEECVTYKAYVIGVDVGTGDRPHGEWIPVSEHHLKYIKKLSLRILKQVIHINLDISGMGIGNVIMEHLRIE